MSAKERDATFDRETRGETERTRAREKERGKKKNGRDPNESDTANGSCRRAAYLYCYGIVHDVRARKHVDFSLFINFFFFFSLLPRGSLIRPAVAFFAITMTRDGTPRSVRTFTPDNRHRCEQSTRYAPACNRVPKN